MGDISLIDFSEDLLNYTAKRPKDIKTKWDKVEAMGKASLSKLGTLGLLNRAEVLNCLSPTRVGRRHTDQVNATMSISTSREQENVHMPFILMPV